MSGGVDSAVAAARAVDAGHEVVGVHMALRRGGDQAGGVVRGCCSVEDAQDAERAAELLGIPFQVWDLSKRFEELVVADFLAEYSAGRTPNPCVRCNEHIKFDQLLSHGRSLGFDAVVTGHYARIIDRDGLQLHRGANRAKDQSYVLAVMGPDRLASALFPLGDVASKDEVRAEAAARGLPMADKRDSYEICFIPDGDTTAFLAAALGPRPGEIVDTSGRVLATHEGTYAFTIGQRKGLGLGRPAADGRPRYVLDIEPELGRVIVGTVADLVVHTVVGSDAVWFVDPATVDHCEVQVRAHGTPAPARVVAVMGDDVVIEATLSGVAPGQSAVLYAGTRVLAQATIKETRK